jgi:hypothetical protein
MSRLSFMMLSTLLLSAFFATPASAVNCDVNACIRVCQKNHPQGGAGQACTSGCLQTIEGRKKAGQCK